jgi:hypothetical protein
MAVEKLPGLPYKRVSQRMPNNLKIGSKKTKMQDQFSQNLQAFL